MGHRSIILLVGALCTFVATNVCALGLGKITLDSALNQQLNAKIELFEVRELTKEQIRVQIASREHFDRIGVDKTYFLSDVEFEVVLSSGSPHIKVISNKLVREPFLNFLVQVQWPSGKLLREYTLLMDLPVFSSERAPAVQPSSSVAPYQSTPSTPARQSAPQQSTSDYNPRSTYEEAPARPVVEDTEEDAATSYSQGSSQSTYSENTYSEDTYSVRDNDTLWEIAMAVRPSRSVSIHQTMLAIQRENPEAFINNNINLLKSGQILRIPVRDDIENLAKRDAVREVAVQNAAWSDDDDYVSDAQLSGSNAYTSSADDVLEPEGRLTLSSPDDSYNSSEGRASGGAADSSTEALENELAITMEQLDKSSRENNDLQSKVSSLEEQIETMERMLEVSNESMRALELSARKNAEAEERREEQRNADEALLADSSLDDVIEEDYEQETSVEGEYAYVDDEIIEEEEVVSEFDLDSDFNSEDEVSENAVDDIDKEAFDDEVTEELVEATPVPTAKPIAKNIVAAPPQAEKGIVDILLENILYIVAGIVVLVGGIFFLMRQKSSDEDGFDEFMEDHGLDESHSFDAPVDEETPLEDDIDLGDFDPGAEPVADEVVEDELEELDSEAQTEDVVTEADIYIAYGRFDRAEEMLVSALSSDPSDEDIRLKLLEVYAGQGDAERFDPHYAKLRAFASPNNIERAETLRDSIPHITEFDEGSFDTSDVAKFASGGVDAELLAESPSQDDELSTDLEILSEGSDGGGEGEGEDEFSLDLGDEVALDLDESTSNAGDDLSFDLDLGDLDSDGDPDSAFNLDLPEDGAQEDTLLDIDESDEVSADALDLDFDLGDDELKTDDLATSDSGDIGSDIDSLDLDFDLGDDSETSPEPKLDEGGLGSELAGLDNSDLSVDLGTGDLKSEETGEADSFDDLDLDLDGASSSSDLGDSLDADLASLDADLDLSLDDDVTELRERPAELSETASDDSMDLGDLDLGDLDLDDAELGDLDAGDTDLSLDLDDEVGADLDSDLSSLDAGDDLALDLDVGDLDVGDLDVGDLDVDGLDTSDLSLDTSDLSLDTGDLTLDDSDLNLGDTAEESAVPRFDLEGDLESLKGDSDVELPLDLNTGDDLGKETLIPEFDLEADLGSLPEGELDLASGPSAVGGDTVINEALNDEYIEQKLSEDADLDMNFDEAMPLEEEAEPDLGTTEAFEALDDDLDLSSLDQELDALTAGVDDDAPVDDVPVMDEPVTDFDDFDDDLEKDEALAETVKSNHVSDKSVEDMGEDTMFDQAIQEVPEAGAGDTEFELPEVDPEDVDDDDLDFLSDSDETATKLDLARAYIDMGDQEGARDIIREVMGEGNDQQKSEAEGLLTLLEG